MGKYRLGRITTVGLPANRRRAEADPGVVFVEILGQFEDAYSRITDYSGEVNVGDLVLIEIVEGDGRPRVKRGSGTTLPVTDNQFLPLAANLVSALLDSEHLDSPEVESVIDTVPEPLLVDWWLQYRDELARSPLVVSAVSRRIDTKDTSDPTYGLREHHEVGSTVLGSWTVARSTEILRHRLDAGWDLPPLADLSTSLLLEMFRKRFPDEIRIVIFDVLRERLNTEELVQLTGGATYPGTDLREVFIAWAGNNRLPADHPFFIHTSHEYFFEGLQHLADDARSEMVRRRLSMGLTSVDELPPNLAWKAVQSTFHRSRDVTEALSYLRLAADHAADSDFGNILTVLGTLGAAPIVNDSTSFASMAVQNIAERFMHHEVAPAWFGSFPTEQRGWTDMTPPQQMYWILREHVQKTESTVPVARDSLPNILKVLLYFCEVNTGHWPEAQIYDNLARARKRLEEHWNYQLAHDAPVDTVPLLPSCTVRDPRLENVRHCEGRFALEIQESVSGSRWVRSEPPSCWCPRLGHSCPGMNGLEPSLEKAWWNWSLTELLAQADASPQAVAIANGMEARDGDMFVTRLGGVANRVIELQERLRCRGCGTRLLYELKYSVNPARYMMTTTQKCEKDLPGCDQSVYINHCRGCGLIIDSRDSKIQEIPPGQENGPYRGHGLYICISCGTGGDSRTAGRICPSCGAHNTMGGVGRDRTCRTCGHHIRTPFRDR